MNDSKNISLPRLRIPALLAALLGACALAACGGGGGGGSTAVTPRLAESVAPAAFPTPLAAPSQPSAGAWQAVEAAVASLPAASGATWVHVWTTAASGEVATVAVLQWTAGMQPPALQRPAAGATLNFEAYNAAGAVTGTL